MFVDHPYFINAVDGTEVRFSCSAINASLVLFEVNGTSASQGSVVAKGFIQVWIENSDDTIQRTNLTATALTQYNSTEVQCRTIVIGSGSEIFSDHATLLVQGKAIINEYSNYSDLHLIHRSIIISW